MNEELRQALMDLLGGRFAEAEGSVVVSPANERELVQVLRLLGERGGRQHRDLKISREHFNAMGHLDAQSGVIQVGAGIKVERLEQDLRLRDFTLGPLSPAMRALDVATLLEGPYAGLRVLPGGRLEPLCLALTAVMADGLRFVSKPSPRSAAGPDLDALFFGAESRFGVLTSATLRLFPRTRSERVAVYSFPDVEALLAALRGAIAGGCFLRQVQVANRGPRPIMTCELIGSAESVERDLSTLAHEVFAQAGTSSGQDLGTPDAKAERELSWDDLRQALEARRTMALYRLSLETVVAVGAGEFGMPLEWGGWANRDVLASALAEADPRSILGGAP